jgi:hypothetical protein
MYATIFTVMSRTTGNKSVFHFVLNFSVDSQQPCTGQLVTEIVLTVLKIMNGISESR